MAVSYIDFVEERLELGYDYGVVGGISFKTEIVASGAKAEQRNALWWDGLGRWQLGDRMLLDSDEQSLAEVAYLKEFHFLRQGSKEGFRFKDWSDYRAVNQVLGTTDGLRSRWQLKKSYTADIYTTYRPITKPVEGTLKIYLDGQEINYAVTNYSTGIISFTVPPAQGQILSVDFEFDLPVQFEADKIEWTLKAAYSQSGDTLHKLGSVFVKQMRIDLEIDWLNFEKIPSLINEPLDLGIIRDTTETLTFSTRKETLASGYVSSSSNIPTAQTLVKIPPRNFVTKELETILNYFWVAKGRVSLLYLNLNKKVYLCRFNSDSLSIKLKYSKQGLGLFEISNLDFFELGSFSYTILLANTPTVMSAGSVVYLSGQARSDIDLVGVANLDLELQFDFGVAPQIIKFTTDDNGFFDLRLQVDSTLTHPDSGKLIIRDDQTRLVAQSLDITTSSTSIPFSLIVPDPIYSGTTISLNGNAPAGQAVILQVPQLGINETLIATAASKWNYQIEIAESFPTTPVSFTLDTDGFSQLVVNRTIQQLDFDPILGIQDFQYN